MLLASGVVHGEGSTEQADGVDHRCRPGGPSRAWTGASRAVVRSVPFIRTPEPRSQYRATEGLAVDLQEPAAGLRISNRFARRRISRGGSKGDRTIRARSCGASDVVS